MHLAYDSTNIRPFLPKSLNDLTTAANLRLFELVNPNAQVNGRFMRDWDAILTIFYFCLENKYYLYLETDYFTLEILEGFVREIL